MFLDMLLNSLETTEAPQKQLYIWTKNQSLDVFQIKIEDYIVISIIKGDINTRLLKPRKLIQKDKELISLLFTQWNKDLDVYLLSLLNAEKEKGWSHQISEELKKKINIPQARYDMATACWSSSDDGRTFFTKTPLYSPNNPSYGSIRWGFSLSDESGQSIISKTYTEPPEADPKRAALIVEILHKWIVKKDKYEDILNILKDKKLTEFV